MTTVALATAVGRIARGMTSVLASMARQGTVAKNGKGHGVTWSLPEVPRTRTYPRSVSSNLGP